MNTWDHPISKLMGPGPLGPSYLQLETQLETPALGLIL